MCAEPDLEPVGVDDTDDIGAPEQCGRWRDSRFGSYVQCRLSGTSYCEFECPHGASGAEENEILTQAADHDAAGR